MESSLLTRDQALSLWSGNTDSKTLDYQRANPRGYQIVRTHTKENHLNIRPSITQLHYRTVQDDSSKQQKKQICKLSLHQRVLPPHSALPIRGKTSKQKLSTNLTLYEAYTNHCTNLRRAETKRKKGFNLEAWEKETSTTISCKKKKKVIIMKRQRNEGTN